MNVRNVLAVIAGGLVMFLLGWLLFGFLFADFFRANMIQYPGLEKDPPLIWAIFLFNVVWGILITFTLAYAGRSGWGEGAKVGGVTMFLLALGIDLEFQAFMNVHKEIAPLLLHIFVVTTMGMIAGAVIGLVRGSVAATDQGV